MKARFFALAAGLLLFAAGAAQAQVTDMSNVGANDESRMRTKQIRDARQVIDDYPSENWKAASYLLLELTPGADGSATLEIADKDRPKLVGIKKAEPQSPTRWLVQDADRIKVEVNYYRAEQTVACSIAKKLRGKAVTLGIFNVYEGQVECFARERMEGGETPAP